MTKSTFTAEEIKAALAVRDDIIKTNIKELNSVYMAGEIVMWHTETASLQSKNESLRAALKELVALKDMKEKLSKTFGDSFWALQNQYLIREPLAWEQARKLINPK